MTGWLVFLALLASLAYWLFSVRRRWLERQRTADARLASLVVAEAEAVPPKIAPSTAPAAPSALAQQKLLFDAAAKAGEAGEPVLSIQLYARLIARYPDSALGSQARAAVESQKKKLAIPKAPGTDARG
ncbi:MAG TPA: hypothetical protein VFC18_07070 [Burkholderiales bacterium]|nr:hypothetical protein [Burkholderiales bacterium]